MNLDFIENTRLTVFSKFAVHSPCKYNIISIPKISGSVDVTTYWQGKVSKCSRTSWLCPETPPLLSLNKKVFHFPHFTFHIIKYCEYTIKYLCVLNSDVTRNKSMYLTLKNWFRHTVLNFWSIFKMKISTIYVYLLLTLLAIRTCT